MILLITGYHVATTGLFHTLKKQVNGNFSAFRRHLEKVHDSDIYFRISEPDLPVEQRIINAVCNEYELTPDDIFVKKRHRRLAEPRQMCQWLIKKNTKLSLTEIGKMTGGKDHATVLHAEKVMESLTIADREVKQHYMNVIADLGWD